MMTNFLPFLSIFLSHDDVTKWKHFPRYWAFVRGIHRSTVNSPHKGRWRGAMMSPLICALNKRLSKPSRGRWLETPSRSLWRHCNDISSCYPKQLARFCFIVCYHLATVCLVPMRFAHDIWIINICAVWYQSICIKYNDTLYQQCHENLFYLKLIYKWSILPLPLSPSVNKSAESLD